MAGDEKNTGATDDNATAFDEADALAMGDYGDAAGDQSLSDAEREALAGDDGDAAEGDDQGEASGADGANQGEAGVADGDDQGEAGGADGDDQGDAGGAATIQPSKAPLDLTPDVDPAKVDEQIKALDEQFDEGEIDHSDYRQQRDDLFAAKVRAETVADIAGQASTQSWEDAQATFFAGDNAKYAAADNVPLRSAFAGALQSLYDVQDNAGKPNDWYLNEAKRLVDNAFGLPTAAPPAQTDQEKIDAAVKGRQAKAPNAPPLSQVPASGSADPGNAAYTAMDELTGLELENAIAGMSEAERDKYLSMGVG